MQAQSDKHVDMHVMKTPRVEHSWPHNPGQTASHAPRLYNLGALIALPVNCLPNECSSGMQAVQPWTCQVTISATCIPASTGRTYSQVVLRQSSISRSSSTRTVWGSASIVKPRQTVRRDCTTVESVTQSAADWRVRYYEGREATPVLWQVSPDRTTARTFSHLPLISAELYITDLQACQRPVLFK